MIFSLFYILSFSAKIPPQAHKGKEAFLEAAKEYGDRTEGMTSEGSINVLQFPSFTDFYAAWELEERERTVALLMDDMQVEYQPYVQALIPQVSQLIAAFREMDMPIFWSVWWRFGPDDGYFNAMDRFYGPIGTRTPLNALYNHDREHGGDVIPELAPQTEIEKKRHMKKSYSLDMFDEFLNWAVPAGQGTLDEELQKLGVDTVVIVGAWTDDCILATAFTALKLQYDVIVISDGVSTASKNHFAALDVMAGSVAKVIDTATMVQYMKSGMPVTESSYGRPAEFYRAPRRQDFTKANVQFQQSASNGMGLEILKIANTLIVAGLGFMIGWLMKGQKHAKSSRGENEPLMRYT